MAKAINAILPYFGGKRTLAPSIVAEFGPHRSYWEPFCVSKALGHQGQRGKATSRAIEVLLINGASLVVDRGLFDHPAQSPAAAPAPDPVPRR
jgi:hypothetical protein